MKLFNQWTPDLTGAWLSPVAGSAARRLGGSAARRLASTHPHRLTGSEIQSVDSVLLYGVHEWTRQLASDSDCAHGIPA
jgi:hypothetical protein